MEHSDIERVRSFNRRVTQRTGALDESYLGRGRPLGQARLLFEIGPRGADLRHLRERLGLDSGYLSRLLKAFERQKLAVVTTDEDDRRRRHVALTEAGLAEWSAYDRLSDGVARSFLEPLDENQRRRLVAAMAEVERIMVAALLTVEVEPSGSEEARACLDAYFRELDERFETGFDLTAGGAVAEQPEAVSGCFMMARFEGRPVGCGMLKALNPGTTEIKRMWVAPDSRGLGVSRLLLGALETEALRLGFTRVRLDTNRTLGEAQSLYRKTGYREIARYNDNPYAHLWFEKELDAVSGIHPRG